MILMKKNLLFFVVFLNITLFSQEGAEKIIGGGFGLNWIDGQLYYTFRINPEFSISKVGVGLDLRFDVDSKGNIRKENFNEFSDYASIIRYVRYGKKNEPLYLKLGALDYNTIGHGSIMYNYNNSPSFDKRKIGLVADAKFDKYGFESIYSSFGEAGVVGLRLFTNPLKFTSAGDIPIIGNLEFGITYSGDFHENAGIVNASYDGTRMVRVKDEGSINIIGFDLGFPIVKTETMSLIYYFDFAKILSFGSGAATGLMFNFSGLGVVTASVKLERRLNGEKYIPSYFNSLYEIERFSMDTSNGVFNSKANRLNNATNSDNGFYGELGIDVMNLFQVTGSYQRLDKSPQSGILHIGSDISPKDASFIARAGYDKLYIKSEKDLFTLDDRSFLYAEVGYKPMQYLLVSMLYSWTFTPMRDANKNIIGYEPQKRIEPRISILYPL